MQQEFNLLQKPSLTLFYENGGDFSVFDVIWKEITNTSWTTLQSRTHAPYLMRMI